MFKNITDELYETVKQSMFESPVKENRKYISKIQENINFCLKDCSVKEIIKNEDKITIVFTSKNLKVVDLFNYIYQQTIINVYSNYDMWFNKSNVTIQKIQDNCVKLIKIEEDCIQLKINFDIKDKKINTKIFDDGKRISYKDLDTEQKINLIVEFGGILFIKNKFTPSFTVKKIKKN